jgi:pyridoxine 4-dehydrogenase
VRPGPARWAPDGRPEHLREACEGSLRRLRLEQIALYQFHRPDPEVPLAESIGALVELKAAGKIRHIGVSNVSESQLREAERITPVVSVQNRYNLVDRESDPVVDVCDQDMLDFLPWAPIQDADRIPPVLAAANSHRVALGRSRLPGCSPGHRGCCRSPGRGRRSTWRRTSPPPRSS